MDRPFFDASISELEALVLANRSNKATLGCVWNELSYRETDRAKQLQREVLGLLGGQVPSPPPPARPGSPDDQLGLL